MTTNTTPDLRYPVGRFAFPESVSAEERSAWIEAIAAVPAALRAAVEGLDERQIDTPYRDGGWTVRQVVHHLADSHMNAYTRCKLALTETTPTIKPYDEGAWADLEDTRIVPIEVSIALLDALHVRWVALLRSLTPEQMKRDFRHPERPRNLTLETTLGLYAWHGRHHVAHITALRERQGW